MQRIVEIILIILLLMVFVQDIKSRAVYWWVFPLLGAGFLCWYRLSLHSFEGLVNQLIINNCFLLLQLLLLSIWFSLKQWRLVIITTDLLGWGDILLLVCLTCCLPSLNFIVFYIGSLMIVLILWLVFRNTLLKSKTTIPLAGLQALLLVFLFVISWFIPGFGPGNDTWLYQIIN